MGGEDTGSAQEGEGCPTAAADCNPKGHSWRARKLQVSYVCYLGRGVGLCFYFLYSNCSVISFSFNYVYLLGKSNGCESAVNEHHNF